MDEEQQINPNSVQFRESPAGDWQEKTPNTKLMSIGTLLGKTWEVFESHLEIFVKLMAIAVGFQLLFFGIAIMAGVGSGILTKGITWAGAGTELSVALAKILTYSATFVSIVSVLILSYTFISCWLSAALIYVIKKRDVKVSLREAMREGWHKMIPYMWIAFLISLCLFGGVILLIIPGIVFAVWFLFSEYVLIDKDIRGTKALFRSKKLVDGYWWEVFGRTLLIWIICVGIGAVLGIIPVIGQMISQFITIPLMFVYLFLLYEDLKRVKETEKPLT